MILLILPEDESADDKNFMLELYEKYETIMLGTAKRYVSDQHAVEDLMQDSVIKLIKKTALLRGLNGRALTSYVVLTVRTTAINFVRHQNVEKKRRVSNSFLTDESCPEPCLLDRSGLDPENICLHRESADEFWRVFSGLPEADQTLLRGRYQLELTDRELARLLGCKPGSVRMMLTRARRRALKLLEQGGISSDKT